MELLSLEANFMPIFYIYIFERNYSAPLRDVYRLFLRKYKNYCNYNFFGSLKL
jgi:hypothetical protein